MGTATATKAGNGNVEALHFDDEGEVLEDRPCLHCGKPTHPSGWYGRHEVVHAKGGFGVTCSGACERAFKVQKELLRSRREPHLVLMPATS